MVRAQCAEGDGLVLPIMLKRHYLAFYKILVRPHLKYTAGSPDPYHAESISKLESVQKKAVRFITITATSI